jgi:phage portal protein BeeE
MREVGTKDYKGQLHYYSKDKEIYPTSPLDSALISASYEKEAQIYPYANIKNGFSGNTIIKYPTLVMGEEAEKEANDLQDNLTKLHGADRAGSSLVVPVTVDKDGSPKEFKMIEHLSPTNVDTLFLNQNAKAENDILKVYNMPKILLGISDQGMFNAASFNDAFDYKNSDTEFDRKEIERDFNKLLKHSIWAMDIEEGINFVPFNMRVNAGQVNI